jgi:hypothetical protein
MALFHHPYRSSAAPSTGKSELKHLWSLLVSGGADSSSARAPVYGVYTMVLYPDRWVGAHKAPTV